MTEESDLRRMVGVRCKFSGFRINRKVRVEVEITDSKVVIGKNLNILQSGISTT